MRFSITVMVAATGAMLLTGGLTVVSVLDGPPAARPVGFVVTDAVPTDAPR
jgi:hypothetical protein